MPILTPPSTSRFWDQTHSDPPTFFVHELPAEAEPQGRLSPSHTNLFPYYGGGREGQRFAFCVPRFAFRIPRFAFRVSRFALRFQWVEPVWVGFPAHDHKSVP